MLIKQQALTLSSIKDLDDGIVAKAFDHELRRAVADCMDRPGDDKARKVQLTVILEPVMNTNSRDAEDVNVEFEASSAIPKRKSKVYAMQPRKGGHLAFSVNNPTDPEQSSLADQFEDFNNG